ncbi:Type II secretory pathway, ATPase PulE/Tfp pilus assembly pathway, ATPase PilB [Megamonas hypermegale ART12/1]|nr:Type II secretory pathway, ATPase PulE/Tfp pilus assembly pathway, ATPase PilB [Megamonas hypermegale ART12/1]
MEIEKDLEQLSLKIMRNLQLQGKHNILQGYRNKLPVADFIDCLLENAYKLQASDIHLEPQEKYLQIRLRIDGKLVLIYKASNQISNFLISYLKLISNLDIAEKRFATRWKIYFSAQNIDIRISTIPVLFGEKVVLRLLGNKENLLNLNQMGFSKMNLKYFKDMISASSGLIVITGPVNSGKSTLLYASLNYLNRLDTNIITIEDPVELNLEGINQMQVNQKAGMDYAVALRASLRQDPDIVMIGEIRDEMVAKQAITTALTGHLVLTTLHTKNALGVPARLIDLGVSPVMLSIALLGMTSQRLVRKICPKCKISYKPSENSLEALLLGKDFYLGMDLYKGEGCKYCNYTGFLGQIALQEILRPTEKMRYLISRDDVDVNLKREARLTDFKSLLDDGKMKVLQGITTAQEVWKTLNGVYQINEVPRNFTKSDSV